MAVKQTAGRDRLGSIAPVFAHLNDDVLFGEVWSREAELSLRDRSLITIAALFSAGLYPQLESHLALGKAHGITKQEAVETVTQLAFYCGWPKAWSTFPLIEKVWGDEDDGKKDCIISDREAFDKANVFGIGQPNTGFARYFIGNSYLNPLTDPKTYPLFAGNVSFEPGCRNNWHIHHADTGGGQLLICTAGSGWYQAEGEEARGLNPGDTVAIPANVKHWHGAKKDSWFAHIAVEVPGTNASTEWCEPVDDEQYSRLGR